jgi:hypothetical protein
MLRAVAEMRFGITYDGPALTDGRMPVRDLAPALFALGELFTEASLVAHPDRDPASLNIKATQDGSFIVDLALHSPDTWDQILNLFDGHVAGALDNLLGIILGAGTVGSGLFVLIRRLNGRNISERETLDSGLIRMTLQDGAVLEGSPEVLALYDRETARANAKRVVEPLESPGVDSVAFSRDGQRQFEIGKDDLAAYASEPDGETLLDHEIESVVTLTQPTLEGKYKWRFSEGDNTMTASLEDADFRARIDSGEAFRQGDMLRVRMHIVQTQRGDKLQTERTIVEVLEHYPRHIQTQIETVVHPSANTDHTTGVG